MVARRLIRIVAAAALVSGALFHPLRAVAQSATLDHLLEQQEKDPQNALLCEQIGVAYTRLNDLAEAAVYFRKAVNIDGSRLSARKNLATVLWFLGEKKESITLFESLERAIPADPVPQLYLALNAYENKDAESAASHFERAGTSATANPETLPLVIETFLASHRAEAARPLLEARIASGVHDAQTYRWLGAAYDQLQQPDKALAAFSTAVKAEPISDDNYIAVASFSLDHGNPAYARKVLQEGLGQLPKSPKLLLEMGLAWAMQGDFERARPWFESANSAQPGWPLPLLALGVTDLQTGKAAAAADCFRTAKELAPDDYRCFYLHAIALKRSHSESNVEAREAETLDLHRAIELAPHVAKVRVALAEAELAGGAVAGAEAQLRQAIEVDPNEPSSFYRLALLYRRGGKTAEAARLLRTFEQLKNKSHAEENEFVLLLKTPEKDGL